MSLQTFDDLLLAARRQSEPQRLLLVFAEAGLPDAAAPAQREAFERGEGGALAPVVCVDKRPEEIAGFDGLCREAQDAGVAWDVMFVAALAGRGGHPPNDDEAVQPLRLMVEQIRDGRIERFLAVGRDGRLLRLQPA